MAEQKKKRQSIADMKRELQAMQIASRRRQQGKKATGESVAKELKAAGSGQSSKPSDKSKYVSPSGKQYAGPGYSAGEAAKPKPKPKPQPTTAAKPKPKPQPTTTAAKPKPKPQPTTTAAKPKPKPKPDTSTSSLFFGSKASQAQASFKPKPKPKPEPKREQFKSAMAYRKAWNAWNKNRYK